MFEAEWPRRPAVVLMGVTGSGKSTIGAGLAAAVGIAFVDGDDLHPPSNVAKMSRGQALSDEDRWPWLDRVGLTLGDRLSYPVGIAVACSALRRVYRDRIRAAAGGARPVFLFLDIPPAVAKARLANRPGHFMPVSLVHSQFETLEPPEADEVDVVTVEEEFGVDATVRLAAAALRARQEALR